MFHHEKLNVYQRALQFAAWSQTLIASLAKKSTTRDQLRRAGDSIAFNIAEGNGKFLMKDRARFFQIAHGSALESAACLDLLSREGAVRATTFLKGRRCSMRSLGCFSRCSIGSDLGLRKRRAVTERVKRKR
jgi:four helix bundle protein